MTVVLSVIKFIVHKIRLHITLTYFIFLWASVTLIGYNKNIMPVLIAFTLWHNSVYLFNKVTDVKEDKKTKKAPLSEPQKIPFLFLSLLFMLLPVLILYFYDYSLWPLLVFYPVGILYSLPLFRTQIRIKNIYLIKNIYAATATLAPAVIILLYYSGYTVSDDAFKIAYILYAWVLFLTIEIISDIPDREGDKITGIRTMATVHGFTTTRNFCLGLLSAQLLLSTIRGEYLALIVPLYLFSCLLFMTEKNQHRMIRFLFYGWLIMAFLIALIIFFVTQHRGS